MRKTLIVLLGPTGVGKTDLSINIAKAFNTEILSCDSRQIYKELRVGTAVPEKEYLEMVPHHFIRTISIHDYYNASKFEFEVVDLLKQLFQTKDQVLMTGGSMMYIDAVCKGIDDLPTIDTEIRTNLKERLDNEGLESLWIELKRLDPEYYHKVDLKNGKRVLHALEVCYMTGKTFTSFRKNIVKKRDFDILKIGLNRDREELYNRINQRVDLMIQDGLIEEARSVYDHRHLNSLNTVGYKELFQHFDGDISLEEAIDLVKRDSRRYARKQLSWFRRDKEIHWFHPDEAEKIIEFIKETV